MVVTADQLNRLKKACRLAKEARDDFRAARLPIMTSSTVSDIGLALSLAGDLLESLVREAHTETAPKG